MHKLMAIFCQKNVKSLGLTINTKEYPDNKKYGLKYGLSCPPMLLNMISDKRMLWHGKSR